MKGFEPEIINTLNDEEIDLLISILTDERAKRERDKRAKLIDAFLDAWWNLRENGFSISYEDEEIDICVDLYKKDCFEFY